MSNHPAVISDGHVIVGPAHDDVFSVRKLFRMLIDRAWNGHDLGQGASSEVFDSHLHQDVHSARIVLQLVLLCCMLHFREYCGYLIMW
jgi:hypothetical protein